MMFPKVISLSPSNPSHSSGISSPISGASTEVSFAIPEISVEQSTLSAIRYGKMNPVSANPLVNAHEILTQCLSIKSEYAGDIAPLIIFPDGALTGFQLNDEWNHFESLLAEVREAEDLIRAIAEKVGFFVGFGSVQENKFIEKNKIGGKLLESVYRVVGPECGKEGGVFYVPTPENRYELRGYQYFESHRHQRDEAVRVRPTAIKINGKDGTTILVRPANSRGGKDPICPTRLGLVIEIGDDSFAIQQEKQPGYLSDCEDSPRVRVSPHGLQETVFFGHKGGLMNNIQGFLNDYATQRMAEGESCRLDSRVESEMKSLAKSGGLDMNQKVAEKLQMANRERIRGRKKEWVIELPDRDHLPHLRIAVSQIRKNQPTIPISILVRKSSTGDENLLSDIHTQFRVDNVTAFESTKPMIFYANGDRGDRGGVAVALTDLNDLMTGKADLPPCDIGLFGSLTRKQVHDLATELSDFGARTEIGSRIVLESAICEAVATHNRDTNAVLELVGQRLNDSHVRAAQDEEELKKYIQKIRESSDKNLGVLSLTNKTKIPGFSPASPSRHAHLRHPVQDIQFAKLEEIVATLKKMVATVGIGVNRGTVPADAPVRMAVVQMRSEVGCPNKNAYNMISKLEDLKKEGVCYAAFPELFISGYNAKEAFYDNEFLDRCDAALAQVKAAAETLGIAFSVGTVDRVVSPNGESERYNSVKLFVPPCLRENIHPDFVKYQEKIVGEPGISHSEKKLREARLQVAQDLWRDNGVYCQHKCHLPHYHEFSEMNYFVSGNSSEIMPIKFGENLWAFHVCEDSWDAKGTTDPWIQGEVGLYPQDNFKQVEKLEVKGVINTSGSPYRSGKPLGLSLPLLAKSAAYYNMAMIYVNTVGLQDSALAYFSGGSFVTGVAAAPETGAGALTHESGSFQPTEPKIVQLGKLGAEDSLIIDPLSDLCKPLSNADPEPNSVLPSNPMSEPNSGSHSRTRGFWDWAKSGLGRAAESEILRKKKLGIDPPTEAEKSEAVRINGLVGGTPAARLEFERIRRRNKSDIERHFARMTEIDRMSRKMLQDVWNNYAKRHQMTGIVIALPAIQPDSINRFNIGTALAVSLIRRSTLNNVPITVVGAVPPKGELFKLLKQARCKFIQSSDPLGDVARETNCMAIDTDDLTDYSIGKLAVGTGDDPVRYAQSAHLRLFTSETKSTLIKRWAHLGLIDENYAGFRYVGSEKRRQSDKRDDKIIKLMTRVGARLNFKKVVNGSYQAWMGYPLKDRDSHRTGIIERLRQGFAEKRFQDRIIRFAHAMQYGQVSASFSNPDNQLVVTKWAPNKYIHFQLESTIQISRMVEDGLKQAIMEATQDNLTRRKEARNNDKSASRHCT